MYLKISVTLLKTSVPTACYSDVLDCAMSYIDHYGFFQWKVIILYLSLLWYWRWSNTLNMCSFFFFPPLIVDMYPGFWIQTQMNEFQVILSDKSIFLAKLSIPPHQESVKGQQWVISVIPFPSYRWAESNPAPVHEVATFVALTEVLGCKYITCFKMFATCFWFS